MAHWWRLLLCACAVTFAAPGTTSPVPGSEEITSEAPNVETTSRIDAQEAVTATSSSMQGAFGVAPEATASTSETPEAITRSTAQASEAVTAFTTEAPEVMSTTQVAEKETPSSTQAPEVMTQATEVMASTTQAGTLRAGTQRMVTASTTEALEETTMPVTETPEVVTSSTNEAPEETITSATEGPGTATSSTSEVPEEFTASTTRSVDVTTTSTTEVPETSTTEVPETSSTEVPEVSSSEVPEVSTSEVPETSSTEGLSVSNHTTPLQCFVCNSADTAGCGDPFDSALALAADLLTRCPPAEAGSLQRPVCRKSTQQVPGDRRVVRSCGLDDDAAEECYSYQSEDTSSYVCQCHRDGCNSATRGTLGLLTLALYVLVLPLIQ